MSLYGAIAESVREGKEVVAGETAVTASVAIKTPFKTVKAVLITQKSNAAPGVGSSVYTYDVVGSTVTIYAWKPTSNADPTLIAGTVASTVSYQILGIRR